MTSTAGIARRPIVRVTGGRTPPAGSLRNDNPVTSVPIDIVAKVMVVDTDDASAAGRRPALGT
jgi:hypothetical protein